MEDRHVSLMSVTLPHKKLTIDFSSSMSPWFTWLFQSSHLILNSLNIDVIYGIRCSKLDFFAIFYIFWYFILPCLGVVCFLCDKFSMIETLCIPRCDRAPSRFVLLPERIPKRWNIFMWWRSDIAMWVRIIAASVTTSMGKAESAIARNETNNQEHALIVGLLPRPKKVNIKSKYCGFN